MPNEPLKKAIRLFISAKDEMRRFSTILNIAMQQHPQPVFEIDKYFNISYLNYSATQLFHTQNHPLMGQNFCQLFRDPLMTERYLMLVPEKHEGLSWEAVFNTPDRAIDCTVSGIAVTEGKIVLWIAEADDVFDEVLEGLTSSDIDSLNKQELILPNDREITPNDVSSIQDKLGFDNQHMARILGVSHITWYKWFKTPDQPITNRSVCLHLRLMDCYPHLVARLPTPNDLMDSINRYYDGHITPPQLGLLLGVEKSAGKRWADGGNSTDAVASLCASLIKLLEELPQVGWERYLNIVELQAQIEGIDVQQTESWVKAQKPTNQ